MTIAFCLVSSDHGAMIVNRFDHNGAGVGVGAQILQLGNYEPSEVLSLKDTLRIRRQHFGAGVVALDCGANIGVHTVEWAKLMKDWGSVIAIEAQERIFYALAGNLTLQNCFNARAIHAAVAAGVGEISFPEPDYAQQGSFGSFELRSRVGTEFIGQPVDYAKPTVTVRKISLDSLQLPRVDLIKMDIEGMEEDGLAGAAETIARCKPVLFVETVKSDGAKITSALEDSGYKVFQMGMNVLAVHRDDKTLKHIDA